MGVVAWSRTPRGALVLQLGATVLFGVNVVLCLAGDVPEVAVVWAVATGVQVWRSFRAFKVWARERRDNAPELGAPRL